MSEPSLPKDWRKWSVDIKEQTRCPTNLNVRLDVHQDGDGYDILLNDKVVGSRVRAEGISKESVEADMLSTIESARSGPAR